jgi:uncharacterized membrane protein YvbJ
MKKCPFCAEQIQDEAVKCRFCGEFLTAKEQGASAKKWYHKGSILIVAFLCVGPLMVPLIWINPDFSLRKKTIITIAVICLTTLLWAASSRALHSIKDHYAPVLEYLSLNQSSVDSVYVDYDSQCVFRKKNV